MRHFANKQDGYTVTFTTRISANTAKSPAWLCDVRFPYLQNEEIRSGEHMTSKCPSTLHVILPGSTIKGGGLQRKHCPVRSHTREIGKFQKRHQGSLASLSFKLSFLTSIITFLSQLKPFDSSSLSILAFSHQVLGFLHYRISSMTLVIFTAISL